LSQGEIARELDAIARTGAKEIITYPTDTFDVLLDEAKSHDLRVWVRDDISLARPDAPVAQSAYLEVEMLPRDEVTPEAFGAAEFVVAARIQGGQATRTRALPDHAALLALDEDWTVLICKVRRDPEHINTLSRPAVERHIAESLEAIEARHGSEFGKTILGIALEAPSICSPAFTEEGWTVPFSDGLFADFEDRYGYSAVANLPYLFFPGHDAPPFRADFWEHVAAQFASSCHGTYSSWCKYRSLSYTNLNSTEGSLRRQVRCRGNVFDAGKLMDAAPAGPSAVETKIASSFADNTGAALSRIDSSDDQKRLINRQFALGATAVAMPWPDIAPFADYIERVSQALFAGQNVRRVAILFPLSGLHAAYQPDKKTEEFEALDNVLSSLLIEMNGRQLDFDVIDFAALPQALEKGYDALIVPYTPYMRLSEYEEIERVSRSIATYVFYRSMDRAPMNVPSGNRGIRFVATEDLEGFVMRLRHSIDDGMHLFADGREDILLRQREDIQGRVAFLANQGDEHRKITIRFSGAVSVTVIDPATGDTIPTQTSTGDKTDVDLHLAPQQAILVHTKAHQAGETIDPIEKDTVKEAGELP
jgi:hypothetical protein